MNKLQEIENGIAYVKDEIADIEYRITEMEDEELDTLLEQQSSDPEDEAVKEEIADVEDRIKTMEDEELDPLIEELSDLEDERDELEDSLDETEADDET
jgi:hypothetical protein